MRAALYEAGNTKLTVDDAIDIADPGPGQVRVKVHHCGLCHSDYTVLHSGYGSGAMVLGHEAAGVVESVGADVTMLTVGDKVVLTPIAPCGRCYWCVRAEPGLCVNNADVTAATFRDGTTGLSRHGEQVLRGLGVGGFAEYALAHETGAVKVPDDTPLEIACVIGCAVQTGVGAVLNTAAVEPGATVLVLGLGGIGLSVVQGARAAGAARIVASDPILARREAALRMGATDVLDPATTDVVGATRELTEVGADYAFEAAGVAALAEVGIEATRAGGTTVLVGAPSVDQKITINPAVLFGIAEKKLVGCFLGSCNSLRDIPRLVAMWQAGQLDLEALITHRRPLDEINDAFADLEAGIGIRTVVNL
jgi:S-(hydroxymethyl)glutathione dehydrogenase / alcohol dehydrogenase